MPQVQLNVSFQVFCSTTYVSFHFYLIGHLFVLTKILKMDLLERYFLTHERGILLNLPQYPVGFLVDPAEDIQKEILLLNIPHRINQKPLFILRKAWRYFHLRNHKKSPQKTHSLDSGQEKQLKNRTKTKRDMGG